jgi:uncharacterized protein YgbK (DUF1537 family)
MASSTNLDCLLIADDLTGACDAAAPFAAAGLRTTVLLSADGDADDARVLAVSTESRGLAPSEVAPRMRQAAARLTGRGASITFKKIDSTLRGNTAVEIAAALEVFGCKAAVVCPAFPAMNRIVRGGCLSVTEAPNFEPLHVASRVAGLHIDVAGLQRAIARGERILSLDAACDTDLDQIAAAILESHERILWTGSAGLAAAMARTLRSERMQTMPARASGPVLFCIGSDHPVTVEQVSELIACRGAAPKAYALLRIPYGQVSEDDLRCELQEHAPSALVLSGGDTASLVLRAAGAQQIQLFEELLPGIPLGILRGGRFDGVAVATKSGAFGDRSALIRIADYFSCPRL